MPSSALRPHPRSTLFPYTTLFRSNEDVVRWIADQRPGAGTALVPSPRRRWDPGVLAAHVRALRRLRPDVLQVNLITPWSCRYALLADRKSTRLNSSHVSISYAVFCFTAPPEIYPLSLHDALPI